MQTSVTTTIRGMADRLRVDEDKVRRLMRDRDVTQEQLAAAIGKSQSMLSRYIGSKGFEPSELVIVAKALGSSATSLLAQDQHAPLEPTVDANDADPVPNDDTENDSSEALLRALSAEHGAEGSTYTDAEVERAKKLVRTTHHHGLTPETVRMMARMYLRAVRAAGVRATDGELAREIAQGKLDAVQRARLDEHTRAINAPPADDSWDPNAEITTQVPDRLLDIRPDPTREVAPVPVPKRKTR